MKELKRLGEVWPEIKAVLAEYHPELTSEVKSFGSQSPSRFAKWLDENFPHVSGSAWGPQAYEWVPQMLREQLENARVR